MFFFAFVHPRVGLLGFEPMLISRIFTNHVDLRVYVCINKFTEVACTGMV